MKLLMEGSLIEDNIVNVNITSIVSGVNGVISVVNTENNEIRFKNLLLISINKQVCHTIFGSKCY